MRQVPTREGASATPTACWVWRQSPSDWLAKRSAPPRLADADGAGGLDAGASGGAAGFLGSSWRGSESVEPDSPISSNEGFSARRAASIGIRTRSNRSRSRGSSDRLGDAEFAAAFSRVIAPYALATTPCVPSVSESLPASIHRIASPRPARPTNGLYPALRRSWLGRFPTQRLCHGSTSRLSEGRTAQLPDAAADEWLWPSAAQRCRAPSSQRPTRPRRPSSPSEAL
ncbi:MAG: hypothetical protein QOJ89_3324 [bacterium]